VPLHAFTRFDYYAKFIRHLQVWSFVPDGDIARVLVASRPDIPLFPALESIHIGADDNSLHLAAPFFSPSLRLVRVNHWDAGSPTILHSSPSVTETLLLILRLPELDRLDLLDTRLPTYEQEPIVVDAFIRAAARVKQLYSLDFTTLRPVFDVLARNGKLAAVFLDVTKDQEGHYSFQEIVAIVRREFLPLDELVLQGTDVKGIELLRQTRRALKSFDFRVHGSLETDALARLTTVLQPAMHSLRVLRCSSSDRGTRRVPTSLYDALSPLRRMQRLEKIVMSVTVDGEDMLKDGEVELLFRSWPNLIVWVVETEGDPESGTPIDADSPHGYGLTLQSLLTIRRLCPGLDELSIPYVDTRAIPSLTNASITSSSLPFDLRLSRCHAHNRSDIKRFAHGIWPVAEFSFEDCLCAELER